MITIDEQIAAIEKEIRETPYHKGTEHHIGMLRARIARLRDKQYEGSGAGGGGGVGYAVRKQGDATVVLVGPPSAGKSTLINALTNAESKVAEYAFTTVSVIPGMMYYKDARIQIFDVPGLIEGAGAGRGRGKEVISVVRNSDLVILMTDPVRLRAISLLETELYAAGIRLDRPKPKVRIEKTTSGGIEVRSTVRQNMPNEAIRGVAKEFRLNNAVITLNETVDYESLIDSFSTSRVYIPSIKVVNKSENFNDAKFLCISAQTGKGLDTLREQIWGKIGFVRVYLVGREGVVNFDHPYIANSGQTINDILPSLGSDIAAQTKTAKIWGSAAKFAGQSVSLSTKLQENMQIKLES